MKAIDLRNEVLGHYSSGERVMEAEKMSILAEEIHYH